jgi:tripartite-type tricarboxylate transporter receptor subunit TctC
MGNGSLSIALACLVVVGIPAQGQTDYPTRPVKIIVPFAAGGPIDVAARVFAESLRGPLGQPVIIENRGGSGGVLGTELVARAEPNGYTLLIGAPGSLVVTPSAKQVRYDVEKDLIPITQIFRSAQVFAIHPSLKIKTFQEFLDYTKANPGTINIGSAGIGTLPHLSIELLRLETRIDVAHVPYLGTGGALSDFVNGQIHALFADIAVLKPQIEAGTVVPLVITSPERSAALPDVPTVGEAGYPTLEVEGWGGLLAPRGIPAAVVERLAAASKKAMDDSKFRESSAKQAWSELDTSPMKFGIFIKKETDRWRQVIKTANIKLD